MVTSKRYRKQVNGKRFPPQKRTGRVGEPTYPHNRNAQYTDLTRQYEEKKAEYESLLERKKAMEATAVVFSGILFRLTELEEIPIDFDEALWNTLIDHVTIHADERIVFTFMDGTEILVTL